MRQILLIFSLFCAAYMTVNGQTNTWKGGGANTNWNTVANWSLGTMPSVAHDVVIPTGFTVNLNVAGNTKSISVQGNSTLNVVNNLSFTNGSSIANGATVVWSGGGLYGGGTLTNNGTINLATVATKIIADGTIITNNGKINMSGNFTLYMNAGSVNNQSSGIIDIQALPNLAPNTSGIHNIVNAGLIKKTTDSGTAIISVALTNSGTITVESGILHLSSEAKTFIGGIYNVTSGASLDLSTGINLSNTMTGLVNGNLNWNNTINVPTTATFNFTGSAGINWVAGGLDGGGTLNNASRMNMTSTSTKIISGSTVLSNSGTLNCSSAFTLYINAGMIKNLNTGTIDIQALPNFAPNTSAAHSIMNSGLIKKTSDPGTATISVAMTNDGTITVENGTLLLSGEAKTFIGGAYNVTAGNAMDLSTDINLSNTMNGLVNGNLNWNSNLLVASAASFNFTGSAGIKWTAGSLNGGGTLTNATKLSMTTTATKIIYGGTTLSNTGILNCTGNFTLYINQGTLNNQPKGVIDIQALPNLAPNTSLAHTIINSGLIKKTTDAGAAMISVALTNSGTLTVESGTLNLSGEAKTFNGGVYNVNSGGLLNLSTKIICSGTITGALIGQMSWNNELNVGPGITATLNFTGATGFNWADGSLDGGGILSNTSKLNMTTTATKSIYRGTILKNSGTINCLDNFNLYINEGVLENQISGTLNIQAAPNFVPNTSAAHSILNAGLIKKTVGTGNAQISVALTNSGTIAVESGILTMNGEVKTFNGGIYNVSDLSVLNLSTQVICSGILTGIVTGPIAWNNIINVVSANPATFNFTGTTGINWVDGSLNGGGTLTNAGKMNMTTAASKSIYDGSTLSNSGTLNCLGNFTLYINAGVLNNESTGVIDIQALPIFAPNTSAPHSIINSGLIKKTTNSGVAQLNVMFTNSGTVDSQMGTLQINANPFVNTADGILKGIATVDLPPVANYTNDGTFAPGGSPGILAVLGDFKSSPSSVLDVDLFGLVPGTGHDVLAITGNGIFDGKVNVNMNFAANVNDKFVVATTSGTISKCTLASTASALYDGKLYAFNVKCNNNKEVVLTLANVTLGLEDYELANNIALFPNPVRNILTIKNERQMELLSADVIDVTGKTINTINLQQMGVTKEVSMENCTSGMYFLKIKGLNGSVTKRVVKQ